MVKEGKDPVDLYSLDEDGDIVFYDARKNKFVKEFEDSIFPWFQKDEIWGKVGPTAQFLSEVVPGAIGLSVGFAATRKPTGAATQFTIGLGDRFQVGADFNLPAAGLSTTVYIRKFSDDVVGLALTVNTTPVFFKTGNINTSDIKHCK